MKISTIFLISLAFWGCTFLLNYLLDKFNEKRTEQHFRFSFFVFFSIVIIVIIALHAHKENRERHEEEFLYQTETVSTKTDSAVLGDSMNLSAYDKNNPYYE